MMYMVLMYFKLFRHIINRPVFLKIPEEPLIIEEEEDDDQDDDDNEDSDDDDDDDDDEEEQEPPPSSSTFNVTETLQPPALSEPKINSASKNDSPKLSQIKKSQVPQICMNLLYFLVSTKYTEFKNSLSKVIATRLKLIPTPKSPSTTMNIKQKQKYHLDPLNSIYPHTYEFISKTVCSFKLIQHSETRDLADTNPIELSLLYNSIETNDFLAEILLCISNVAFVYDVNMCSKIISKLTSDVLSVVTVMSPSDFFHAFSGYTWFDVETILCKLQENPGTLLHAENATVEQKQMYFAYLVQTFLKKPNEQPDLKTVADEFCGRFVCEITPCVSDSKFERSLHEELPHCSYDYKTKPTLYAASSHSSDDDSSVESPKPFLFVKNGHEERPDATTIHCLDKQASILMTSGNGYENNIISKPQTLSPSASNQKSSTKKLTKPFFKKSSTKKAINLNLSTSQSRLPVRAKSVSPRSILKQPKLKSISSCSKQNSYPKNIRAVSFNNNATEICFSSTKSVAELQAEHQIKLQLQELSPGVESSKTKPRSATCQTDLSIDHSFSKIPGPKQKNVWKNLSLLESANAEAESFIKNVPDSNQSSVDESAHSNSTDGLNNRDFEIDLEAIPLPTFSFYNTLYFPGKAKQYSFASQGAETTNYFYGCKEPLNLEAVFDQQLESIAEEDECSYHSFLTKQEEIEYETFCKSQEGDLNLFLEAKSFSEL